MTPAQRIKREILIDLIDNGTITIDPSTITADNIDELFSADDTWDDTREMMGEFRTSGIKTGLPSGNWSRHYESEEVAYKLRDGTWVGWTYWHGGGKWGEPEAIEWIDDAYDLDVTETEKMMIVREFKVKS